MSPAWKYIKGKGPKVHIRDLIKVSKGIQLKGIDYCWQINDSFPGIINTITLKDIDYQAKYAIVYMINQGRIYIRKEDL